MTDQQLLTIAIAIVVPTTALIYSSIAVNKRIDDLEKRVLEHIDHAFEHTELLLKLHEAEHHRK